MFGLVVVVGWWDDCQGMLFWWMCFVATDKVLCQCIMYGHAAWWMA